MDNVIVANELIEEARSKIKTYVIVKVNFEEDYHSVM